MNLDFNKTNGLVPVIIQDYRTLQVLMLGYMNEEAFLKTQQENKVTFFSRSKNRLWTKGESSGNFLLVKDIQIDFNFSKNKENSCGAITDLKNSIIEDNYLLNVKILFNVKYL